MLHPWIALESRQTCSNIVRFHLESRDFGHKVPQVVPFCPFLGEGSPTKIDCKEKGTLIRTSLPEDLSNFVSSRIISGGLGCSLSATLSRPFALEVKTEKAPEGDEAGKRRVFNLGASRVGMCQGLFISLLGGSQPCA